MADLIPADPTRCQAEVRAPHGAFRLGPPPSFVRCSSVPAFIAVEVIAGADGQLGAMSLCRSCSQQMLSQPGMTERVRLVPIKAVES